jgi:hypothetical protein
MQFSPFTRHLIPLRSKYPPQHHIAHIVHITPRSTWF